MKKILMVDDEVSILHPWETYFKLNGFKVEKATTVQQAIEKCKSDNFDVVLSDIRIPNHTEGLEFAQKVREIEVENGYSPSVLLMITAYGGYEFAKRACDLGADGFIEKPVKMDYLLDVINTKLKGRLEKDILLKVLKEWSARLKEEGDDPSISLGYNEYTADEIITEIESGSEIGREFRSTFIKMFLEFTHPAMNTK